MSGRDGDRSKLKGRAAIDGMMEGLGKILERLNEVAEQGGDIKGRGAFGDGSREQPQGVYGFSVKVGLGKENGLEVEPFGNIRPDAKTGEAEVHETREPVVDVFEEDDHTLVVAEMPGIGEKDVELEVRDDVLSIHAEHGNKKYRKEVLLPRPYTRDRIRYSCNNGVLEIRCNDE